MDPYRDSLEGRVTQLEKKLVELQKDQEPKVVISAFKESLAARLRSGDFWAGLLIVGVAVAVCAPMPSCISAMSDTPEEIAAEEAVRQQLVAEREASCRSLNMHYVGYDRQTETLTCGNETEIANIDLNDDEVQMHSLSSPGQ